jgi:aromatic ring-opening dioxygenase catalytic subunit (LigB family)
MPSTHTSLLALLILSTALFLTSRTRTMAARAPIWSIAHGGPPTLFDTEHKAHKAWVDVGRAIVASQARALVVVSAHWEAEQPGTVLVNEQQAPKQIYDFYNL